MRILYVYTHVCIYEIGWSIHEDPHKINHNVVYFYRQWEKRWSFLQMVLKYLSVHMQKLKLDPYLMLYAKVNQIYELKL